MPHLDTIKDIVAPLRFSFVPTLMRPEVRISVDFRNGTWRMHNIRKFDADGAFVLEQGRYGRCPELAYHVYQELIEGLKDNFTIELWRTAESKFFPLMMGEHIVLRLTNTSFLAQNIYIVDPTYHKYGSLDDFDSYYFVGPHHFIPFKNRNTDETLAVGAGSPILLATKFMISLAVVSADGVFDEENFGIGLYLSRPYKYRSRLMFQVRKKGGETQIGEVDRLTKAMKAKEYYQLRDRTIQLFERITGESVPEDYKKMKRFNEMHF